VTKRDLLKMLSSYPDESEVIIYDGDDSIFKLEFYGYENNNIWLNISFETTVEDL